MAISAGSTSWVCSEDQLVGESRNLQRSTSSSRTDTWTLDGVVANEADKNLVNIRANSAPGVFSVTNNLQVEQS
ncbi:MAG: hypothetical protein JWP63_970 [Candidatus Solibacter sp.]|jgi:hypothetical protein|nr:hypothetical protein [Candidatus Solibacter sp.]